MSYRRTVIYHYDGTFSGFLCCVFSAFQQKEMPAAIAAGEESQETLFGVEEIATQEEKANRVLLAIPKKISRTALELVQKGFLTCLPDKEMKLLQFLILGFRYGAQVEKQITEDPVYSLIKAIRHMENESHLLLGFLRFSDLGEFLAGEIAPKNMVLPIIVPHFAERFSGENFLIWDKTHLMGYYHPKGEKGYFFQGENLLLPAESLEEKAFQALWKTFYQRIAVEGRINPKLRRTHCPMRYWDEMVELKDKG
jgi:probable DNA metabolism protein